VTQPNTPDAAQPLNATDLADAFTRLCHAYSHLLVAVSGGADSTALVLLLHAWAVSRGRTAPRLSVATVDHRLRPASTAEADAVAVLSASLGLAHTILPWLGDKPTTGIQTVARDARFHLLRDHATHIGADAIVFAHTRDDQAETVLMRLARGSGADGLGGMDPVSTRDGMTILRPLLTIPKSRLIATLRHRGIAWIEDPSNANDTFERVRWREASEYLTTLGLTATPLAETARRLRRARTALDTVAAHQMNPEAGVVRLDPLGFAIVTWPELLRQPDEIRLRVLIRLIERVGGAGVPVPLARLEAMTETLDWRMPVGRTLGRVMFMRGVAHPEHILLVREPGHTPAEPLMLSPGESATFDGRWRLGLSVACPHPLHIAALGGDGWRQVASQLTTQPTAPREALHALPAAWDGATVSAVPALGFAQAGVQPRWLSSLWT
jgi:tRNA(Ile)-lysidine synthase